MDPTTIIVTAIVGALGKLSESVVKDTYEKLKSTLAKKYSKHSELADAVEKLEKKPDSVGRAQTLKEEIDAVKADQDPEVVKLAQALLDELNRLGISSGSSTVVQQAGDNVIQIAGPVSGSTISLITEGITGQEFNRARSDDCNDKGRERIRAFGERMVRSQEWDWHPLGQAIEYYVDAIKHDPRNQHAWTNLAYVYHLIGQRHNALECLAKALELATPGPNYPGGHYKQVKAAVDSHSYLSGGRVSTPSMPDWFRDRYARYLR